MGISDRIAVLHFGEVIAEGPPEAIRANPRVIDAYLGGADD
jgi:branched-chain amino acid transport system ATP-binding protein